MIFVKKTLKICGTVILLMALLGALIALWFLDHSIVDNGLEFLIYMIGYGDTSANILIRLILAVLGILLVGVFSSYITLIFIEQKSKLTISKRFYFQFGDQPTAHFTIKTKRWELYDVEVKLIYRFRGHTYKSSHPDDIYLDCISLPYLPKNHKQDIILNIQRGSILYSYLQSQLEQEKIDDLIVKIDFINGKNNQSYSAIQKYDIDRNIVVNEELRRPNKTELDRLCGRSLDLNQLKPCNEHFFQWEVMPSPLCETFPDGIGCHVNLTNAMPNDFGMLYFQQPLGGNWEYFYNENYYLTFQILLTSDMDLKLEIKNSQGVFYQRAFYKTDEPAYVKIPLRTMASYDVRDVKEMCFTAFHSDQRENTGDFYIRDCKMEK